MLTNDGNDANKSSIPDDKNKKRRRDSSEQENVTKENIELNKIGFQITKRGRTRTADDASKSFTYPSGASQPTASTTLTTEIPTRNKFDVLKNADDNEDEQCSEEYISDSEEENEKQNKKYRLPPPTVLHGKPENYNEFVNMLKRNAPSGFTIRQSTKNTTIYFKNTTEWKTTTKLIKSLKIPSHTFTHPDEKTHAFVLRGMLHGQPIEVIKYDLIGQGIDVVEIYKMKTYHPTFMVITTNKTKLKHLQQKIVCVDHSKAYWERHRSKKRIIQCRNCQRWDHATSNCNAPQACLKCAENHLTRECTKDTTLPATCINCSKSHPANSTECEVYIRILTAIEEKKQTANNKRNEAKTNYVPAPIPSNNPWQNRINARGTKKQESIINNNNTQAPTTVTTIPASPINQI